MKYILSRVFKSEETIIGVYNSGTAARYAHYRDRVRIWEADKREGVKPSPWCGDNMRWSQWSGWSGNNHYTYKIKVED